VSPNAHGGSRSRERARRNFKRPDAVQRDRRVTVVRLCAGTADTDGDHFEWTGADDQHDDDERLVLDATGSGAGWNVTVNGNAAGGKSAVFKQCCPNATCGSDSGPGYVSGGQTLAANSLTLSSTGASFTGQNGTTGTAPTLQCAGACNVDSASAVKIASAAVGTGMGTWATTGWGGSSLALSTPSTLKTLQSNEVYRVGLVWTINSGP
jgi:hypothetical protein